MQEVEKINNLLSLSSDTAEFGNTFIELNHDFSLDLPNESRVEIFHLRKSNKSFTYNELKRICIGNICQYVFNRVKNAENISPYDRQILTKEAIEKFREIRLKKEDDEKNQKDLGQGGELGELLLYLFLEKRLNAPKILSKMEIKTTRNQYVYGADGVHLYETKTKSGKPNYQFIIGESKIKNDILAAIRKAFESINSSIEEIDIEQGLVSLGIFNEVCDREKAESIKKMILPSEDITESKVIHEKAFGIFIGYSVDLKDATLSNEEWNEKVDQKIKSDVTRGIETIKKQVKKYELDGYSLYIYFLPFNNADEDKEKIMSEIL